MTNREYYIENGGSLPWCRPYESDDGRVKFTYHEFARPGYQVMGLIIDGEEVTAPLEALEADIERAARVVNDKYDDYGEYDPTHILLGGNVEELDCRDCPWFEECDAMEDEC